MPSRRSFCTGGVGAIVSFLSGCLGPASFPGLWGEPAAPRRLLTRTLERPNYPEIYGEYTGEPFAIAPFDYRQVDPQFLRQTVEYRGSERIGTIIVDPQLKVLHFVEASGRATRYGVGVGREGFSWSGEAQINMKRNWPDWIPPHEMIERTPEIVAQLERTPRGMGVPGGPRSPLGARSMYLFGDGRDLGYRIHGTTEPETIGANVSSGCIRMVNQDIAHLYTRAAIGTRVIVLA
jgi:lipoprotein-anchoring transpeptidase ErfK/SrfK